MKCADVEYGQEGGLQSHGRMRGLTEMTVEKW